MYLVTYIYMYLSIYLYKWAPRAYLVTAAALLLGLLLAKLRDRQTDWLTECDLTQILASTLIYTHRICMSVVVVGVPAIDLLNKFSIIIHLKYKWNDLSTAQLQSFWLHYIVKYSTPGHQKQTTAELYGNFRLGKGGGNSQFQNYWRWRWWAKFNERQHEYTWHLMRHVVVCYGNKTDARRWGAYA